MGVGDPSLKLNIKWSGKQYEVVVNPSDTGLTLKAQLSSLTGVDPDRQKILVKGGALKDDALLSDCKLKDGQTLLMMGTAGELPKEPAQKARFIEDMTDAQRNLATKHPAGLNNLGNTCYLNSTLQCLRGVSELSSSLKDLVSSFGENEVSNVAAGLRDLFKMMDSSGESVMPLVFLQVFRTAFPQFAHQQNGRFSQQDAEECWTQIVHCLRAELKLPASPSNASAQDAKNFIDHYMGGEMTSTWKCTEAESEPAEIKKEPFDRIKCHISISINLLSEGIREGLVEKDIEKNSPSLNRMALYTKTSQLSRLPKYLTVQMIRFFWKRESNVKSKILRKVKFSMDLDVTEFCTPELREKLKPGQELVKAQSDYKLLKERALKKQKLLASADTGSSDAKDEGEPMTLFKDVESKIDPALLADKGCNWHGQYELTGVLTHVGRSADSGHYISWGRKSQDEWYKYDDDKVSVVKAEEILKLEGGGDFHMAYMMLYRMKPVE